MHLVGVTFADPVLIKHHGRRPTTRRAALGLLLNEVRECADVCRALGGVPFVFYVGRTSNQVFPDWPHAPVLVKPAGATVIVETVAGLIE